MGKVTAIYSRVSSRQQDERSQIGDLERWVELHGSDVVWFRDKFTGLTMDRPGWNELYRNVQIGAVGKIVVWRLDRLGRTAPGLTNLFEELYQRGVGLISLKDGLDLSTPAGRLMANLLASVAQFETEIRAERIKAGQAAASELLGTSRTSCRHESREQVRWIDWRRRSSTAPKTHEKSYLGYEPSDFQ